MKINGACGVNEVVDTMVWVAMSIDQEPLNRGF
jgi:hypothetical protein